MEHFSNYNYFLFLHTHGENKIIIGTNSNLPANISNINTHLEKALNVPKFSIGPTPSRPGPMLLSVAATAVKFVSKLPFSKEIKSTDAANISTYSTRYTLTERRT